MTENVAPRGMPRWRETCAPQYDGIPRNIARFFNDVKSLCVENGISEEHKWIEYAISYARPEDYEFWDSFKNEATWDAFQKKIKKFLGLDEDNERAYTKIDLRRIAEDQHAIPIATKAHLGEYLKKFWPVATFLKSKTPSVGDDFISDTFIFGLPILLSRQIRSRLAILKPNHHADDPYNFNDIHDAANYILSSGTAYTETDAAITAALPAWTAAAVNPSVLFSLPGLPSLPAHIPRPTFDASVFSPDKLSQAQHLLVSMAQLMASPAAALSLPPASMPTTTLTTATAAHSSSFVPTPRSSHDCNFCSDSSHYMRDCGILADYLNRGLCRRDATNSIVLPNGERVTSWTAPGRNIRERIDNWQCNQPQQASPNTVSTNFSGYNPIDVQDDHRSPVFSLDNSITNWGIEEAVDDEWPYVSEMSQQEIDEIRILEALVVETRKKVDTAKRKLARTSLPVLCSAAKNPIITAHLPPPTVSKSIPTAPSSFPAIAKLSPPPPAVPRSSPMPHLPNCQHFEFHTAIKDPKLVDSASEVVTEKAATSSTPDASKESASFHCEPDSDVAIVESLETSAFLSNSIPSSPTNDDPEPVDSKMYELRPFHTVSQASTRHCPARNARVTLADPNLPRVITAPTLPCNRNHTQSNPITSVNVVEITEDSLTNDCAGIREETPFSTIDPSDTPYTLHDFLPLPPLQFHAQLNYPHFNSCSSQPEDPGWPPPIAFLANLGPPAIPHIYPSPIQFF